MKRRRGRSPLLLKSSFIAEQVFQTTKSERPQRAKGLVPPLIKGKKESKGGRGRQSRRLGKLCQIDLRV